MMAHNNPNPIDEDDVPNNNLNNNNNLHNSKAIEYSVELMEEMTEDDFDDLDIEPNNIPVGTIQIYKRGRQPLAFFRGMPQTPGTRPKGIELGLTETEIEDLGFPLRGQGSREVTANEYPELIEKAKFRCGITKSKLGNITAWAFSIGCGITTAATMAVFFTGLPLAIAASIMFVATTIANYRMGRFDIPEAVMNSFKSLYTNKALGADGHYHDEPISAFSKICLAIGALGSIGFGIAIGLLTANAIATLPATLAAAGIASAGALSVILPPVGIVFGAVTVVSLAVIMIKAFSNLVKNKHILENSKNTLKNLFYRLPEDIEADANRNKLERTLRLTSFVLGRVFVGLSLTAITTTGLALAYWGAYATLQSCVSGLHNLVKLSGAVDMVVSNVIVRGLGMVAQIPFTFQTTMNTILYFFIRQPAANRPQVNANELNAPLLEQQVQRKPLDTSKAEKADGIIGAWASFVNALGNGMLARNGQPFTTPTILAIAGAFLNSFFSTLGNTLSIVVPVFWKKDNNPNPVINDNDNGNGPGPGGNGDGNNVITFRTPGAQDSLTSTSQAFLGINQNQPNDAKNDINNRLIYSSVVVIEGDKQSNNNATSNANPFPNVVNGDIKDDEIVINLPPSPSQMSHS